MAWWTLGVGLLFLVIAYWELKICEGTHLGRGFVIALYDRFAGRYDHIKGYDQGWERAFLGQPVAEALSRVPAARLLDVGAGTGRLARATLPLWHFHGTLVNLEPSSRMLARGRRLVDLPRTPWVQAVAVPLPFTEGGFDVVVCLEVIEFTPDPAETLSELVRVLRPGGWLLITNRVGWEAALILGKTRSRARFPNWLRGAGLTEIEVYPWQVDYDLVWARKPIPDLTPSMER